jgi:hypothetical protein
LAAGAVQLRSIEPALAPGVDVTVEIADGAVAARNVTLEDAADQALAPKKFDVLALNTYA